MSFREQLKLIRSSSGATVQQIADYIGVPRTTVSGWLNTDNRTPNPDQVKQLSEYFRVPVGYFFSDANKIKFRSVPLVGKASCGIPKLTHFEDYEEHIMITEDQYSKNSYAVTADGDSMFPKIKDGDVLYINPDCEVQNGDTVHYFYDGQSGIKKYINNGKVISLIPINTEYNPILIDFNINNFVAYKVTHILSKA